jgi:hypothetical protein
LELPRTKLFIGHGAEVNAVVADSQGQWFVTAGADQTVAAWSLVDWPAQATLGASFIVTAGQLAVTAVDIGSPAWEAGLSVGDVVDLLAVDGRLVWDRRPGRPTIGTPEEASAALRQPQPGTEYFFSWPVGQSRRSSLTRLKQRPLWKWFPLFDEQGRLWDSVIWMWYGNYYYTSSLSADHFIGWHINDISVDGTPQFHPLTRYQHLLSKPEVIRTLIRTRSLAAALRLAQGDNPQRSTWRQIEPPFLELAVGQSEIRTSDVPVRIRVQAVGNNPDWLPQRLELWLNDYRYHVWDIRDQHSFQVTLEIPARLLRIGENQVVAVVHNPARGRAVQRYRLFKSGQAAGSCQLFGLAVGVNNYRSRESDTQSGSRELGPLQLACQDAQAMRQVWLQYHGPHRYFSHSRWRLLLDQQVRLSAWRQAFLELQQWQQQGDLRPDDLLIVFFSGHGDVVDASELANKWTEQRSRRPAAVPPTFVLCCQDYSPHSPQQTAVRMDELIEWLVQLNCRKLVLLDACRTGGVADALRRILPTEQGPIVLSACGLHERSYEDAQLGHGVFTYALLEALGARFRAADRNSDGVLTVEELYRYVAMRVPELSRGPTGEPQQHPVCFPPPDSLPPLPLVMR